jgi:hypothetical protein
MNWSWKLSLEQPDSMCQHGMISKGLSRSSSCDYIFIFIGRGCQWFFREFRPPLSWMGGCSMLMHCPQTYQLLQFMLWHHVARAAREYSKCFFTSYNNVYAHYVRSLNEWFENFEIDDNKIYRLQGKERE